MPPAAGVGAATAAPAIGKGMMALLGIGAGASGIGSILGAKASQPKFIDAPKPDALFPWLNKSYTEGLGTAGPKGLAGLQSMAETGEPVAVGDTFETMLAAQQRLLGQGRAGLREQFGSQGLAGSSSFREAAVDYESQQSKDFANILAQLVLTSGENAAQRKLGASSQLAELFSQSGTAMTPSKVLTSGGSSATGAGLSSAGSSMTTLALLRAMKVI